MSVGQIQWIESGGGPLIAVPKLALSVWEGAREKDSGYAEGADDYARAERFLAAGTMPLVAGMTVRPNWLPDGRFWYRATRANATEFVVVDPAKKTSKSG